MKRFASDPEIMKYAIQIAHAGFGTVEPNPMVGAVIVSPDRELIAEGSHLRFGEAHAEINAIRKAGERTRGADLFVSLEPCSHFGKTPPCADAVIAAGFRRVVIGCQDPAPHVSGRGIAKLQDAGIVVETGVCEEDAKRLIAPFEMLMRQKRPWLHAKWAMTLDGRVASCTGHSQWISCEQSRAWVHQLRGRVDAIVTGSGTVRADNPLLTARPAGPRTPLRVVIDSRGDSISADSQLVTTIDQAPVLICVSQRCSEKTQRQLKAFGCQVLLTSGTDQVNVLEVLKELGRRQCTHVVLEAGPGVMGTFFDQHLVNEIHAFVAPKLLGGIGSLSPVGGEGLPRIPVQANLTRLRSVPVGDDLLIEADCLPETLQPETPTTLPCTPQRV